MQEIEHKKFTFVHIDLYKKVKYMKVHLQRWCDVEVEIWHKEKISVFFITRLVRVFFERIWLKMTFDRDTVIPHYLRYFGGTYLPRIMRETCTNNSNIKYSVFLEDQMVTQTYTIFMTVLAIKQNYVLTTYSYSSFWSNRIPIDKCMFTINLEDVIFILFELLL